MTPQERLAMIKAAAEKRKAAKTTQPSETSTEVLKKKIELSLKTINDYQRMRQLPDNLENIIIGILSKTETDPTLKNYALNYNNKEKLINRTKEIEGFLNASPISVEQKEKFKSIINQLKPFIDKLPNEKSLEKLPPPVVSSNIDTEKDDLMRDYEYEISSLRSKQANLQRDIENILKANKGQVVVGPLRDKVITMKQELENVSARLISVEKDLSDYKKSLIQPKQTDDRSDWLASKKSANTAKKKPEADDTDATAWLKSKGIDDTMLEQLNESSTVLLKTMELKTGLPMGQLEKFWELAVKKNKITNELRDSLFWGKVMKDFQKLIDEVDIEEARNIMETREQYKSEANNFLNAIAEDNYIQAQDAFKKMVASRLDANIADRAERYCQDVLSKEAKKLANDL